MIQLKTFQFDKLFKRYTHKTNDYFVELSTGKFFKLFSKPNTFDTATFFGSIWQ